MTPMSRIATIHDWSASDGGLNVTREHFVIIEDASTLVFGVELGFLRYHHTERTTYGKPKKLENKKKMPTHMLLTLVS